MDVLDRGIGAILKNIGQMQRRDVARRERLEADARFRQRCRDHLFRPRMWL